MLGEIVSAFPILNIKPYSALYISLSLTNFRPNNGRVNLGDYCPYEICNHNKGVLMKNKFLVVAFLGVILGCGMALISCGPRCPGGNTSEGSGKCYADPGVLYRQCTDKCITDQGTYAGYGDYYNFDAKKSCTCN
jgi:hypothetical protein